MRISILMTLAILTSLFVEFVQTGCCQQKKGTIAELSCKYQEFHKDEECTNSLEHFKTSECVENQTICKYSEDYNLGDTSFLNDPTTEALILI